MPGAPRDAHPVSRRWGWHRLDPRWAERVVASTPVGPGDLVLDLGAGDGALTVPLLAAGARVLAVELHPARAAALRERCAGRDAQVIVVDLADLRLPGRPFRVVANPPWAATTSLLRSLLGSDRMRSADLVLPRPLTAQAVRRPPAARHGRRYRLTPGPVVPRHAFTPPPGVDARVLRIRR